MIADTSCSSVHLPMVLCAVFFILSAAATIESVVPSHAVSAGRPTPYLFPAAYPLTIYVAHSVFLLDLSLSASMEDDRETHDWAGGQLGRH